MDYGNGGCCIARWTDEGQVSSSGYDMSKMDKIMLKFRPIAPKPVSENGSVGATSDSNNNSSRDGRHAKATVKGRRKSNTIAKDDNKNNNRKRCNSGNVKKRKSNSCDTQMGVSVYDLDHRDIEHDDQDLNGGVTLLPLFPESPDLSPTKEANNMPMFLNFNDNIMPMFEDNYGNCLGKGW